MTDQENRTYSDKFMLRLPDGMRDRIKFAAEKNGRSMNGEIVAILADWFPDPTAEEYLAWLHRELSQCRQVAESITAPDNIKRLSEAHALEIRAKMIAVIDREVDPARFAQEIAEMSDYHAVKRGE